MSNLNAYAVRWPGPTLIARGRDWRVGAFIENSGAAPTFDAAPTLTVRDRSGNVVVDAATMAQSGSVMFATVAAAATASQTLGQGWTVEVSVIAGGITIPFFNDAVLCVAALYSPVGPTDLVSRYSRLDDLQVNGDQAALQSFVNEAWGELTQKLYEDSVPFWKLRSPAALRPWMMARSLSYALDDLALVLDGDSHYASEARRHEGMLDKRYKAIAAKMDESEDNTLSDQQQGVEAPLILTSGRSQGGVASRRFWRRKRFS